ncbi:4F2 cell-surface antigen heavy chain [Indicator indicator]|uniref:4F2 cell-surface antigen heavy chain n=1 Tax=Indicator indicator TaxID=1002788 RepID=UPI0023DF779E|nr:4F2 cell-surface antigen heavy chain [Indicator indicator]
MLGAAAAIVARAPPCRPLPSRHWWQLGALYRAPPKQFGGDLKGVAARLEHVAGLGARGLILGPLHPQNASEWGGSKLPPLDQLEPSLGSLEDFGDLLQAAKKKGLQLLVDLTPKFGEGLVWGGLAQHPQFNEHMKGVLSSWLQRGVGGFLLDSVEELPLHLLSEWQNLTQAQPGPEGGSRVLVGGSQLQSHPQLLELLQRLGEGAPGGPLLGRFQEALEGTPAAKLAPQLLSFLQPGVPLVWSVGSPWQHLTSLRPLLAPQALLLLWALPGTPALSYGDELGLQDLPGGPQPGQVSLTQMPWELLQEPGNSSQLLELCRQLGALRSRERSLALGEAEALDAGPQASAFLRSWDQSQRFLVLLNPGPQPLTHISLRDPRVPPSLTLRLRTHQPLPPDPQIKLEELQLEPYEGALLSFPYTS